jgi:small subunit ribosomal protein S1
MQEYKFEDAFMDFGNMPSSMEELLSAAEQSEGFTKGKIVKGKIAQKRPDGALIDIGYKAEGFVPAGEFQNYAEINVGDEIDVYLEEIEISFRTAVIVIDRYVHILNL